MFDGLSEKQIKERVRYLSDKIESIWEKILPDLQEFDIAKSELDQLYIELNKRGILDVKIQSRDEHGENV